MSAKHLHLPDEASTHNPHESLRCLQSGKQKFNIEASFQNSSPINRAKKEPIRPFARKLNPVLVSKIRYWEVEQPTQHAV